MNLHHRQSYLLRNTKGVALLPNDGVLKLGIMTRWNFEIKINLVIDVFLEKYF